MQLGNNESGETRTARRRKHGDELANGKCLADQNREKDSRLAGVPERSD